MTTQQYGRGVHAAVCTCLAANMLQRRSSMRPHSRPIGVNRRSALSDRNSRRYSEREVSIRYGSRSSFSQHNTSSTCLCIPTSQPGLARIGVATGICLHGDNMRGRAGRSYHCRAADDTSHRLSELALPVADVRTFVTRSSNSVPM